MRLGESLVHLVPHMLTARRLQVPHGAFHVGVAEPLLNRAQIDASPQASRSERGAELVKPEAIRVEFRTFRNGLEAVEKVELASASRGREYKGARFVRLRLPCLEIFGELRRNRNLAFLVPLRRPSSIRLMS